MYGAGCRVSGWGKTMMSNMEKMKMTTLSCSRSLFLAFVERGRERGGEREREGEGEGERKRDR